SAYPAPVQKTLGALAARGVSFEGDKFTTAPDGTVRGVIRSGASQNGRYSVPAMETDALRFIRNSGAVHAGYDPAVKGYRVTFPKNFGAGAAPAPAPGGGQTAAPQSSASGAPASRQVDIGGGRSVTVTFRKKGQ